jgi:enamine deaminase RidA (YjgF/YER057c/UK114 family)
VKSKCEGANLLKIKRLKVGTRMSQAVVCGNIAYLAGQVTPDASIADVAGQTQAILQHIETLLAEAGSGKDRLLSATIWLKEISTFDEMNSVWDAWLPETAAPARACVEAKFPFPHVLVEIQVTAALPASA